MAYEKHILELLTNEGYDKRFEQMCVEYDTYEKAFRAVERQFKSYFGKNRYNNYESYRVTRAKRLKRKI